MNPSDFWAPYRGAVSLTFDDGTDNQLERAVPPLNELGLHATFYLHARDDLMQKRFDEWQAVAGAGHEIGNHSLSHPCTQSISGNAGGLETLTLQAVESDILAAQERLARLAPHQQRWTFAYPCYNTFVGRGASRQSYVPVVAKHFLAARAGGEYGFGNRRHTADLACLGGLPVERKSGFEMIGLVEELTARGLWVILVFHEISGVRLSVAQEDYLMLLHYLHRRKTDLWIAPVAAVAGKIKSASYS